MMVRLRQFAAFLRVLVIVFITLLCGANAHGQSETWFVDHTAMNGNETGADWANAFLTIQDALANEFLAAGDEIRVADGTYYASVLRDDRTDSIEIDAIANENHNNIVLRGGYAGLGAANPNFFCPRTNVTIISGDIGTADADDLDTAWDHSTRSDNSYHILRIAGVGVDTVIEGFTIEGGNADDTDFFGGAAVVEDGAQVNFVDCIFANNSAGKESTSGTAGTGGAVFIDTPPSANKVVKFLLCRFFNNTADQGSAVYLNGTHEPDRIAPPVAKALFLNCVFVGDSRVNHDDSACPPDPELVKSIDTVLIAARSDDLADCGIASAAPASPGAR